MPQQEYERISELAEEVYAKATTLSKFDRWVVSAAADLIMWAAYLDSNPSDPEARYALSAIASRLPDYCHKLVETHK